MSPQFSKKQISLAVAAAIGAIAVASQVRAPDAEAAKTPGKYVTGDIHNHTTCSDGSISMQKLVKKSTDTTDTPWGLDWFVQAGHGGTGNRNCTLIEDATFATPAYPVTAQGPNTTWVNSGITPKGDVSGSGANRNMWRWQALQEFQYPIMEYLNALRNLPIFLGLESVVAGHEHTSMAVITGQMPAAIDTAPLPTTPGYTALGNATALSQWTYCFDRGVGDLSRGNTSPQPSTDGNNWDCSVTGSLNSADPSWSPTGRKLNPTGGAGTGDRGHNKTVEGIKWMAEFHPNASYYIPAHIERAGPFNPNGNNGFNAEHIRNFNNAGPNIAYGMETQPGHGASSDRGEYLPRRQTINGVLTDSVGGTTYGGTGVYGAQIGGMWDAMLGEGRNWWFSASSDWHNRGSFGVDDRRTTQDFYPGEYQRMFVMVRNGADKLRPQTIIDGMRTGNKWVSSGQVIDRLAFVACASYGGPAFRSNASVEAIAVAAATNNTDIDANGCATMGEKLVVRPGAEIVVTIVVRDPAGTNYAPYTFNNPSLVPIGINQPLNMPVLDHVDLIRGLVTGYRTPGTPEYNGQWPTNTAWLGLDGSTPPNLDGVPAGAKNTSTAILKTFSGSATGSSAWVPVTSSVDGTTFLKMTFRIPAVQASQYVRLRGTNLPPSTPFETDASGNPLSDLFTNSGNGTTDLANLRIQCTAVSTNIPANNVLYTGTTIDGCPNHLPTINGVKYSAFDIAAWADLWFYSNPIYIEVAGRTRVAGVR
ncbi:MAG: hypothetical protein H7125_04885 [Proteobacteria bacterium]|nr:hypothetical protein [Burkholderiales bacterium]